MPTVKPYLFLFVIWVNSRGINKNGIACEIYCESTNRYTKYVAMMLKITPIIKINVYI